jgi:hypothetical protein
MNQRLWNLVSTCDLGNLAGEAFLVSVFVPKIDPRHTQLLSGLLNQLVSVVRRPVSQVDPAIAINVLVDLDSRTRPARHTANR